MLLKLQPCNKCARNRYEQACELNLRFGVPDKDYRRDEREKLADEDKNESALSALRLIALITVPSSLAANALRKVDALPFLDRRPDRPHSR